MLQTLRDKTSGWIATVILGLLIVPFAFVGIEQYMVQRTDNAVARIEIAPTWWRSAPSWWPASMLWRKESITRADFDERFNRARDQARQQQGANFDAREFEKLESRHEVLDGLIDERVRKLAAEVDGVIVSDALVVKSIQGIPDFQDGSGKFNQERYILGLQMGTPPRTPTQFEQYVRDTLQTSMLPAALAGSSFATASETDRLIKLLGEKRDISLIELPPQPADTADVAAADIQKWYDGHGKDFRLPESVSIEYVELNAANMPAPAAPTEADLLKRYEAEKNKFQAAEQRLVSHIQINVPSGADAAGQKAAEDKAKQVATQAKAAGADFAALARANSDDLGSKAAGGDLGWMGSGAIPGAFNDAAFKLQAGQVSDPVKAEGGWHIIQVREIKSGSQQPFEAVRETLLREETESARERAFNEFSAKLVDQVYKNPTTLEGPAKAAGLTVQKLAAVTRNAAANVGVAQNPAVVRAAFSDQRIQDNTVSDPIDIGQDHSVLIRVVSHTPERAQPLAQVRDKVIAAVRADRATKAAEKNADALIARIVGGEALAAIASSKQLPPPQELPGVVRGMPMLPPEMTEAIFAVQPAAQGKIAAGKARLPDGRYVVFAIGKIAPGDKTTLKPAEMDMLRSQTAQAAAQDEVTELTSSLRKRMQIKVVEENLR